MNLLINIDVENLEQAVSFYCTVFELTVARHFGAGGVELLGSAAPIYLLCKTTGSIAVKHTSTLRDYQRHWTPIHLDFVVDEVESIVQRAIVAGAQLEGDIETHNWGRIAHLADPFGHGFCLIQFLGRGYDEVAQ